MGDDLPPRPSSPSPSACSHLPCPRKKSLFVFTFFLLLFFFLFFFLFQADLSAVVFPPPLRLWPWPRLVLNASWSDSHGNNGAAPSPSPLASADQKPSPDAAGSKLGLPPQSMPPTYCDGTNGNAVFFPSAKRVAVCLVGGARAFELTGPSINKFLLASHSLLLPGNISDSDAEHHVNVDVFLHAPLDQDAWKLSVLSDASNLVHFRIFPAKRIPETREAREVLTSSGSPNGIQGLLQYFHLVEGCAEMIEEYQTGHAFVYDWIIRTRVDAYWNDYIPPLDTLDQKSYTVPEGCGFGGLNDRLGIGTWDTSKVALSRLSFVPILHANGFRGLNSETFFKKQLQVSSTPYKLRSFPFCVLSRRKYGWPPGMWGTPVLSIGSKGPLNGAKCRPCTAIAWGTQAEMSLHALAKSWGWIGKPRKPELCNGSGDWEAGWEAVFDKHVVDPAFAQTRRNVSGQTFEQCVDIVEVLKSKVQIWDAPTPHGICQAGNWKL